MERGLKGKAARGREDWRKAGLYAVSVGEAAVALPWAPAFYVSAVWKRISEAERLPNVRAAVCFSLKHPQKRPLLRSAPHPWCENLGPADRRSIKRSVCVRARAAPKLAWAPAFEDVGIANWSIPPTQRAQSPASCSPHLLSRPPACAAPFSCCCVRISSVKHQGWEPGSSVCIYSLFRSPSKDNGISLGPKSLLG